MLEPAAREALESRARRLCEAGEHGEAAAEAVRGYGPELLAYLIRRARGEELAEEAFATFCEDLVRGLPGFEWRASLRTWCYATARHALHRVRADGARRGRREVPLGSTLMSELGGEVRERTRTFLRTERREAFARLREQLSEEEDELLVLRLGRRMSWLEITGVVAPETEEPRRAAAQLRKRYQRIKERLKELADATSETDPER